MARQSGMNEGDATAMALLSDDGLEATYLASNLRQPAPARPSTADAPRPSACATGCSELQELLDQGLITQQEHDEACRTILGSL